MKKFSAAATTALALVAGPALADNVGNVGAVNQSAHGTPPGAAKRSLSVGLGVQRRERIETSPYGSAQIVFNDTSTMTVGRNSAVTVDDFVYSQGGGGQQGVSMAKGVMRFVGGGVSHEGGTRLRTPTASIGVRGGTALVRVGGSCGTLVVHQYGFIDVGGQALTRPAMASARRAAGRCRSLSSCRLRRSRKSSRHWRAVKDSVAAPSASRRTKRRILPSAMIVRRTSSVRRASTRWVRFGSAMRSCRAAPMSTISLRRCRRQRARVEMTATTTIMITAAMADMAAMITVIMKAAKAATAATARAVTADMARAVTADTARAATADMAKVVTAAKAATAAVMEAAIGEGGHGGGYEGGEGGQYSGGGQGSHGSSGHGSSGHGSSGHGSGGHGGGPVAIDGPGD